MRHTRHTRRSLWLVGCAALAWFGGAAHGTAQAQPLAAQTSELAGAWQGDGWGSVQLRSDGTGTYTDTYGHAPGWLRLRRTGARTYVGNWGEALDRHGVVVLLLESDGRTLRGAWTPDPECTVGTRAGASLLWTRR